MAEQRRRPTMHDVGREAGVSQSTVSFVLNNVHHVRIASDTRARVFAAARKLGYPVEGTARRTHSGPFGHIHVLIARDLAQQLDLLVLEAAQQAARHQECLLTVHITPPDQAETLLKDLSRVRTRGAIYLTAETPPETLRALLRTPGHALIGPDDPFVPARVTLDVAGGISRALDACAPGADAPLIACTLLPYGSGQAERRLADWRRALPDLQDDAVLRFAMTDDPAPQLARTSFDALAVLDAPLIAPVLLALRRAETAPRPVLIYSDDASWHAVWPQLWRLRMPYAAMLDAAVAELLDDRREALHIAPLLVGPDGCLLN